MRFHIARSRKGYVITLKFKRVTVTLEVPP